jgi:hypothetical protein
VASVRSRSDESMEAEVKERELLEVDSSWTKFVESNLKIAAGIYLVFQRAKLSVREVLSDSGRFR